MPTVFDAKVSVAYATCSTSIEALFNKHIAWSDAGTKFVIDMVRKAVSEDRERYRGQPFHSSTDTYRAGIKDRVPYLLSRLEFDRSQVIKDNFPLRKLTPVPSPITLSGKLHWH